jgi:hypothetical protein
MGYLKENWRYGVLIKRSNKNASGVIVVDFEARETTGT